MAQLVISAAGAVIGFYIGGPAGAQVGWVAGSLIGAAVAPSSIYGPRLSDTKVQISSYAAAVPIPYGGVRLAGNVIWSTDLVEHESSGGGKGGQKVTSFSYTVSMASLVCDGPIGGIRKIWADAKLVYDISEDADEATQVASAAFADYMTVYLGSEAQLPDATIEASEGVGNVEAYRGSAYVVFTDLPLGNYGNRIPSFSFEVTTEPSDVGTPVLAPLVVGPWSMAANERPIHSSGDTNYAAGEFSGATPQDFTDFETAAEYNATQAGGLLNGTGVTSTKFLSYSTDEVEFPKEFAGGATIDNDYRFVHYRMAAVELRDVNIIDFGFVGHPFPDSSSWCGDMHVAGVDPDNGLIYWTDDGAFLGNGSYLTMAIEETGPPSDGSFLFNNNCTNWTPRLVFSIGNAIINMTVERVPSVPAPTCQPGDPDILGVAEMPGNPGFCLSAGGAISPNYHYEKVAGTFKQLASIEYRLESAAEVLYQQALGPVLPLGHPDYDNATFWADARAAAITAGDLAADAMSPVVVSEAAQAGEPPVEAEAGTALLSDIVTDICLRAGLSAGQIDVTALTDVVQGYTVTKQMPARAALEPLRQAFYFDAVENDTKVVFVKRGGGIVASITADDLGASESGEVADLVVARRAQETELPAEVNVAYQVRTADYQTGAQQARRSTTGSQQVVGVELPIVMPDQKGAEVADVLMLDAWQGRTERIFRTTRKWSKLLPTDTIALNDGAFDYAGRITQKLENGPVIEFTMRDQDPAAYAPHSIGSVTSGGGSAVRFDGPTRLQLLDLPALRDDDDDAGFYAAAGPIYGTYRGAALYKSPDDVTYSSLLALPAAATMGYADSVLASFAGGNMVDEEHIVTVVLFAGTLASITRTELLAGGNTCVLGNEIVQFQRAELVATLTYELSGLLRGRKGTEQHMVSHASPERFVLLSAENVYRVSQNLADIGDAYYKGVTYGATVVDAGDQLFENTAAALKPYSVAHLAAADAGGGDYSATWVRRTRIGGTLRDGVEVPLAEASEAYSVEVERAGVVLSTTTVYAPTATVAALPGDIVRVYQLSSSVGRGFPAQITI